VHVTVYFWNYSQVLVLLSQWLTFIIIQASFLVYWDLFLQGCYTAQKFSPEFYTLCSTLCFITLSSYLVGKWHKEAFSREWRRRCYLIFCWYVQDGWWFMCDGLQWGYSAGQWRKVLWSIERPVFSVSYQGLRVFYTLIEHRYTSNYKFVLFTSQLSVLTLK